MGTILTATNPYNQDAGTPALNEVDLENGKNEVFGLIDENGAATPTPMRPHCDSERPISGDVVTEGMPTEVSGPQDIQANGIAMIPQEDQLADESTVVETTFLGHEEGGPIGHSKRPMSADTRALLVEMESQRFDPEKLAGRLPKGSIDMVASAKQTLQSGERKQSLLVLVFKRERQACAFNSYRLQEMLEAAKVVINTFQARKTHPIYIRPHIGEVVGKTGERQRGTEFLPCFWRSRPMASTSAPRRFEGW